MYFVSFIVMLFVQYFCSYWDDMVPTSFKVKVNRKKVTIVCNTKEQFVLIMGV